MRGTAIHLAGWAAAAAIVSAVPARAELVNASDPAAIKAIVESRGWPATLVTPEGEAPYIETSHDGIKFVILFMNCDAGKQCRTLQYYMGFNDAKGVTAEKLNLWNREKRFGRAYRDEAGDPILEMDLDLDFAGIPRENVGESLNTWAMLMTAFREHVFAR